MQYELPKQTHGAGENGALSFEMQVKEILARAKLSREWDVPLAHAATDAAEMSAVDIAYWLYKVENPILTSEKGVAEALLSSSSPVLELPAGFRHATSLSLSASGDLMPLDGIEASRDVIYENVSDILFDADISFANLEAAVTRQPFERSVIPGRDPENCTLLRSSFAQFDTLAKHKDRRFNVLSFANNHSFDLGIEGLETTQQLLADNEITAIGTPRTPGEYGRATVLNKGGIKLGFISATFGLNNRRLPANESHRIHTARLVSKYVEPELELLTRQIEDCKRQNCDFIVASLHWGYEYEFFPRSKQMEAAHTLIERGVDLILGHHPHVVQPVEHYRTRRDPNRIAVIAYSLGGLTYDDWNAAPHLALGLVLNMKLSKGRFEGATRTYIENAVAIPVLQNIFRQDGVRLIRVEKLKDHADSGSARLTNDWRRRVAQIKLYADLVLG